MNAHTERAEEANELAEMIGAKQDLGCQYNFLIFFTKH
jgi:hypothetical protein